MRRFKGVVRGVLILMVGASLLECSPKVVDDLAGTSWVLDAWANEAISPAAYGITLEFGRDGGTSGQSAINYYGSAYEVKQDKGLLFGSITMTKMSSTDPGKIKAEMFYMEALPKVRSYEITGDRLILKDQANAPILIYHSVPFHP